MVAGPTLVICDATFAVNACFAAVAVRSQRIDSGAPELRAAHVDDGAGLGVDRSRPVASTHARMPRGRRCAHVDRAAIVCHGRIAGPADTRYRRVTGMSEQAVLGGARHQRSRDDVDIPRSHDDGVANAAVVRLYGARFNSGREVS